MRFEPRSRRTNSVLLVEDHHDTRELYAIGLESAGFSIVAATSAEEALEHLIGSMPDVLITDVSLPGMSGAALCRHLRRLETAADLKLVAVTGRAMAAEVADFRDAGFDAVLVKPCLPDELADAVRKVLHDARERRARFPALRNQPRDHANERTKRATRLQLQSLVLLVAGGVPDVTIPCPACEAPLAWRESNRVNGVRYDYFHPCTGGCGEYLFDHLRRRLLRLRA